MGNFCSNCGAANPADALHCGECGAALQAEAAVAAAAPARNWKLVGLVVAAILAVGVITVLLIGNRDQPGDKSVAASKAVTEASAEPVQLYTITTANVRDKPTTIGSIVTNTLPRGSLVTGVTKADDDGSEWLALAEDKGFVAMSNLSELEPPKLVRAFADRIWVADQRFDIYGPATDNEIVATVAKGTKLTLSGLTAQGLLEVKLREGGLGYIRDGRDIVRRFDAKPIAISFNPATCNFGGELGGLFERISARSRAEYDAADQREYPTEEARNTALGKLEGRSNYQRLERNFDGLLLTGMALHYESQSLYFADPPAKVIETFRAKGFRIDRSGNFPSTELYAGIAAAQGDARRYGATDLGCGV